MKFLNLVSLWKIAFLKIFDLFFHFFNLLFHVLNFLILAYNFRSEAINLVIRVFLENRIVLIVRDRRWLLKKSEKIWNLGWVLNNWFKALKVHGNTRNTNEEKNEQKLLFWEQTFNFCDDFIFYLFLIIYLYISSNSNLMLVEILFFLRLAILFIFFLILVVILMNILLCDKLWNQIICFTWNLRFIKGRRIRFDYLTQAIWFWIFIIYFFAF